MESKGRQEEEIGDIIPIIDIIPRKESLKASKVNPGCANGHIIWEYLTLYNQRGDILLRSVPCALYINITLDYRGLRFIAMSGYTGEIVVTWKSVVDFVNGNNIDETLIDNAIASETFVDKYADAEIYD